MVKSEYLSEVFDREIYPQVIRKVRMKLRHTKYDAIAFRGVSGSAVAFPLAVAAGKGLLCVRKHGVSHSRLDIEGTLIGRERYIIVDDFINSGKTLMSIKESIEEVHKRNFQKIPECVAIVLYKEYSPGSAAKRVRNIFPKVKVHVIDRFSYIDC